MGAFDRVVRDIILKVAEEIALPKQVVFEDVGDGDEGLFEAAIRSCVNSGVIVQEGAWLLMPRISYRRASAPITAGASL